MLAEIGDDRTRFADDRALKAYAGSAPVTRASPARSSPSPTAASRTTVSPRSAGSGTYASINQGPAREHYRHRRDHGDRHAAALRHLFNKMLGQLYHCLQTRQTFDPVKVFGHPAAPPEQAAA